MKLLPDNARLIKALPNTLVYEPILGEGCTLDLVKVSAPGNGFLQPGIWATVAWTRAYEFENSMRYNGMCYADGPEKPYAMAPIFLGESVADAISYLRKL